MNKDFLVNLSLETCSFSEMIDTWSMGHSIFLIGVSLAQVFVLRKMFTDPNIEKSRLKVRT